jgi:hypothetical protein
MTAMVSVEAATASERDGGWDCTVSVGEGAGASRHVVHVQPADLGRWGRPGERPEELVGRAFAFLLAREPASQVLRRFDLSDVQRYFPEFDREIRR